MTLTKAAMSAIEVALAGLTSNHAEPDDAPVVAAIFYMPSNSSDGAAFEAKFCDRCVHDAVLRSSKLKYGGCEIHTTALCGDQPWQWR